MVIKILKIYAFFVNSQLNSKFRVIKLLPEPFEEFKEDTYYLEYFIETDKKLMKFLNSINFKHIVGFKNLWAKNCVPFGYKRNFVLFVDLNQSECPVYRIDYRKTADFESRKLLDKSCAAFIESFSISDFE